MAKTVSAIFVESDERDRSAYIVLDGIDEAFESDRIRLFSILQDLKPDSKGNLRINVILAGRPHLSDALFDALETDSLPWIPVDANKIPRTPLATSKVVFANQEYSAVFQKDYSKKYCGH
jgi:hypothetical protein